MPAETSVPKGRQNSITNFCIFSDKFLSLTKSLCLSNDDFIRTTENRHLKSVQEIWNRLVKSGDIYLDKYSGWYSVSDEAFYDKDEIEEIDKKKFAKISCLLYTSPSPRDS